MYLVNERFEKDKKNIIHYLKEEQIIKRPLI